MKIKSIICVLIFLIALVALIGLVRADKGKDKEVKEFIEAFDKLTISIVEKVGNPLTIEGVNEARNFLESNKAGLKDKFEKLKKSGNVRVNFATETELDNCLERNIDQIRNIPEIYLKKIAADLTAYNDAKEKFYSKRSRKNLEEMKRTFEIVNEDEKVRDEVEKIVESYATILEQNPTQILEEAK